MKLTLSDEHTHFVCGFCGGECIADTDPPLVAHYLPSCQKYQELEPFEFLKASREEHARKGTDPITGKLLN